MGSSRKIAAVVVGLFVCAILAGWVLGQHGSLTSAGIAREVGTSQPQQVIGDPWRARIVGDGLNSAASGDRPRGGETPPPVVGDTTTTEPRPSTTTTARASASSPPTTASPAGEGRQAPPSPSMAVKSGVVVAWQPSHQDDTGDNSWHEYSICGDIVQRTVSLLADIGNVLAWETGMGLTGSNNNGGTNRPAFNSELAKANEAGADYFISIHNDGGAPSGVLGMYFVGDDKSAKVAERLALAVSKGTGLPYRGLRGHDLYSLDPKRNDAPVRILLEIGDNAQDRAFLEDPGGRQKIAASLAAAVRSSEVGQ
jgi:N-acetylmuramoyl-L-alanine amidase